MKGRKVVVKLYWELQFPGRCLVSGHQVVFLFSTPVPDLVEAVSLFPALEAAWRTLGPRPSSSVTAAGEPATSTQTSTASG